MTKMISKEILNDEEKIKQIENINNIKSSLENLTIKDLSNPYVISTLKEIFTLLKNFKINYRIKQVIQ